MHVIGELHIWGDLLPTPRVDMVAQVSVQMSATLATGFLEGWHKPAKIFDIATGGGSSANKERSFKFFCQATLALLWLSSLAFGSGKVFRTNRQGSCRSLARFHISSFIKQYRLSSCIRCQTMVKLSQIIRSCQKSTFTLTSFQSKRGHACVYKFQDSPLNRFKPNLETSLTFSA